MNKGIATELQEFCQTIADRYSNVNRVGNVSNESFTVEEIIPTSDHTACVNFSKTGGKVAVAFFIILTKEDQKVGNIFFPTDSHVNGFQAFLYYKLEAERRNYSKNF